MEETPASPAPPVAPRPVAFPATVPLVGPFLDAVHKLVWGEDEAAKQLRFHDTLMARWSPCPPFFRGTFQAALNHARTRSQMLMVYLFSEDHEDADEFRVMLTSPSLVTFSQANVVSWLGDVRHSDAYRLCTYLGASTFPFVAMLAPGATHGLPILAFRAEGLVPPDDLIALAASRTHVQDLLQRGQQHQEQERTHARDLRQQQDEEYEQALRQERERRAREAAEQERIKASEQAEQAEHALRQRQLSELQRKLERVELQQARLRARLPAVAQDSPDAISVQVRLPGGTKVQRNFSRADRLQVVLDFIRCEAPAAMLARGYKYQVVSLHPRQVWDNGATTLEAMGLGKRMVLIAEDLPDGDKGSDGSLESEDDRDPA